MKGGGIVSEAADHDIPCWCNRKKNSHNLTYLLRLTVQSKNIQHQFFMTLVFLREMSLPQYTSQHRKMYYRTNHHKNLISVGIVQ